LSTKIPDILVYNVISDYYHDASIVNLALGYPTLESPEWLKELFIRELGTRPFKENPYGLLDLRTVVSSEISKENSTPFDPHTQITITGSASEAVFVAIQTIIEPGDRAIIFEPAFAIYAPSIVLAGGIPVSVRIDPFEKDLDFDYLKKIFQGKIKLLILNTPHNPTGKVFTEDELRHLADLCKKSGTYVISDEVFDRAILTGEIHKSLAGFEEIRDQCFIIGDTGKKFNFNGLKIGYSAASESLTDKFRRIQQLISYRFSTPLENVLATALSTAPRNGYYEFINRILNLKCQILAASLQGFGVPMLIPSAGFFILLKVDELGFKNPLEFCQILIDGWQVAALPGTAFYMQDSPFASDASFVRFCFARDDAQLKLAAKRLTNASQDLRKKN